MLWVIHSNRFCRRFHVSVNFMHSIACLIVPYCHYIKYVHTFSDDNFIPWEKLNRRDFHLSCTWYQHHPHARFLFVYKHWSSQQRETFITIREKERNTHSCCMGNMSRCRFCTIIKSWRCVNWWYFFFVSSTSWTSFQELYIFF